MERVALKIENLNILRWGSRSGDRGEDPRHNARMSSAWLRKTKLFKVMNYHNPMQG